MLQMLSSIRHERPLMFCLLPIPAFSVQRVRVVLLWHAECQHAELLAALHSFFLRTACSSIYRIISPYSWAHLSGDVC